MHFLSIWHGLVEQCLVANRQFREGIALGTPKLNAYITESLAVHLVNSGYLAAALPAVVRAELARGAGSEPDVLLTMVSGAQSRLEVKATGPTTWQRASAKDAAADFFIWINLGPYCADAGAVHVWVVPDPGRFLRAGLDWRSEREFARLTAEGAVCVKVPLGAILPGT